MHLPNFEVGSDAFATFKDLFTRHKTLAAQFLTSNFDQVRRLVNAALLRARLYQLTWAVAILVVQVFAKYNSLLMSENYVTRRQSLKLLGEILLDRSNFEIMMKYIG